MLLASVLELEAFLRFEDPVQDLSARINTGGDALSIAKSLPDYAGNIRGIVPQFGGRCFDITLDTLN